MSSGERPLDLEAYLARIAYAGARKPAARTLAALHEAHLAAIPFENIDVRLGRPIELELEALEAKLVRGRRGGYCFEHNTLFAAALRALGFEVETLEARVRPPGVSDPLPRTHMVLRVALGASEGGDWLADVGFGGDGPLHPVRLDGLECEEPGGVYRVAREGPPERPVHVLRLGRRADWRDLYAFTLAPVLPIDMKVANHYTATHPSSTFVRALTVQSTTRAARHILRGRRYTLRRGDEETTREVTEQELPELLLRGFGLELPADDLLRALNGP